MHCISAVGKRIEESAINCTLKINMRIYRIKFRFLPNKFKITIFRNGVEWYILK
jgi:hypothetical protein